MFERVLGADASVIRKSDFQLLILANLVAPLGTALVSPLLNDLTTPFEVSGATIGLMMTAYTAPSIVAIPLLSAVSDRWGRRRVLVPSLLLFGLAGTSIALTTDFRIVLVLRFFQGIAFGGIVPVIVTSIGDLYREGTEATAQGLRFTSSGLTQAVFPVIGGGLVAIAWQYPFGLYAVAIPIAWVIYGRLKEPSSQRARRTPDAVTSESLWSFLKNPAALAFVVSRLVPSFLFLVFFTYNSFLVVHLYEGTPVVAGIVAAGVSIMYAFTATQSGRIVAVFGSQSAPLVGSNFLISGGLLSLVVGRSTVYLALGVLLLGVGVGISLSLFRSSVNRVSPPPIRGRFVGVTEASGRIGATVAPLISGAIIATLQESMGFLMAVRLAVAGLAIVGSVVGTITLLVFLSDSGVSGDL